MHSSVVRGAFWMTREVKISLAEVGHVVLDFEANSASWCLPTFKTDARALGKTKVLQWVCGSVSCCLSEPCDGTAV